jgi:AmmeMemoRadiSam system protein B
MLDYFFGTVEKDKKFAELKNKLIQKFNKTKRGKINGIIVPHAGWMYSGLTAAYAYDLIMQYKISNFKKFILIGPNHTVYLNKLAVDESMFWQTSLGKVKIVDKLIMNRLIDNKLFVFDYIPHEQEHDLEVQIPFLQYLFGNNSVNLEILPIIAGEINLEQCEKAADKLLEIYDDDTLFIISTDLSHYQQQQAANRLDKNTIDIISSLNFDKCNEIDACGKNPLLIIMFLCKKLKTTPFMLKYMTSGDVIKDYNRGVVGYASMVF